jgi:hypothetical protein
MIFPSYDNPAKIVDLSEKSFDLPSELALSQLPSSPRFGSLSVFPTGRDHLDALGLQLLIKLVTVVRLLPNELPGFLFYKPMNNRVLHKPSFMPVSTFEEYGDRKTSAVCHRHDLRTLAPLRISKPRAPFFLMEQRSRRKNTPSNPDHHGVSSRWQWLSK